jgi:hypothetical protein
MPLTLPHRAMGGKAMCTPPPPTRPLLLNTIITSMTGPHRARIMVIIMFMAPRSLFLHAPRRASNTIVFIFVHAWTWTFSYIYAHSI